MGIYKVNWAATDDYREAWMVDLVINGKRRRRQFPNLPEAEAFAAACNIASRSFKTTISKLA